jgi:hypothetical protein
LIAKFYPRGVAARVILIRKFPQSGNSPLISPQANYHSSFALRAIIILAQRDIAFFQKIC